MHLANTHTHKLCIYIYVITFKAWTCEFKRNWQEKVRLYDEILVLFWAPCSFFFFFLIYRWTPYLYFVYFCVGLRIESCASHVRGKFSATESQSQPPLFILKVNWGESAEDKESELLVVVLGKCEVCGITEVKRRQFQDHFGLPCHDHWVYNMMIISDLDKCSYWNGKDRYLNGVGSWETVKLWFTVLRSFSSNRNRKEKP